MADYDEMMRGFTAAGAAELKPLIAEAAEALRLDADDVLRLGGFISKAWMDGAMAGQDSMLAQAAEQGFVVENRMIRGPQTEADDKSS